MISFTNERRCEGVNAHMNALAVLSRSKLENLRYKKSRESEFLPTEEGGCRQNLSMIGNDTFHFPSVIGNDSTISISFYAILLFMKFFST